MTLLPDGQYLQIGGTSFYAVFTLGKDAAPSDGGRSRPRPPRVYLTPHTRSARLFPCPRGSREALALARPTDAVFARPVLVSVFRDIGRFTCCVREENEAASLGFLRSPGTRPCALSPRRVASRHREGLCRLTFLTPHGSASANPRSSRVTSAGLGPASAGIGLSETDRSGPASLWERADHGQR